MRQVGSRLEPELVERSSGLLLAEGARFNEAVSRLASTTFMPKGVYRFRSHDEANRQQLDCLALGMGLLAVGRG